MFLVFQISFHLPTIRNDNSKWPDCLPQQISPGIVNTEIEAHAYNEPGRVMETGVDAKNIADAVLYILSTPPELQVGYSLRKHFTSLPSEYQKTPG